MPIEGEFSMTEGGQYSVRIKIRYSLPIDSFDGGCGESGFGQFSSHSAP